MVEQADPKDGREGMESKIGTEAAESVGRIKRLLYTNRKLPRANVFCVIFWGHPLCCQQSPRAHIYKAQHADRYN